MTLLLTILVYLLIFSIAAYILSELYKRLTLKKLKGEIALVTGGGGGIGRMLCERLAEEGVTVVVTDINKKGAEETVELIKNKGGKAECFIFDVSDYHQVYTYGDEIINKIGHPTILINNAGIVTGKNIFDANEETIKKTMEVNVNAHFWTTKKFVPKMIENNHGHVVTASAAGIAGTRSLQDYCASKFAAFGFSESLRLELNYCAPKVDTMIVCPYYINTGMFDGVFTKFPFILPILNPAYVTSRIIDGMKRRDTQIIVPNVIYLTFLWRFLSPVWFMDWTADLMGLNNGMDSFRGRNFDKKDK
eukprot:gene6010-10012_t